ncbi:energy-coupling factor ABC transporter ATP-binding protein [Halarcobacter bivalviorum]|uniref:Cobalt ABC transporter ATP-binding protein n=1 Tax=Halarcobacter bivalviorum TaxID=663364 RepID=A0AAX2A5Z7_9BACT|nr:ABC transporter ATP-binding protein [Halarcobacter bivalviorum]AXH11423.1 cobalt/nickel ECF transporter CbiMNQO, A component, ATP-binding protein CbiO [Halarcobacter bivalviorum]RXK09390.1 cobalt ABC transporter ATP-binding protein [Halarcobacter bivalviorum]
MSCSINVKNVSYEVNEKTIFENITLNVSHEEKIAIIGSNGSGKSSFLKILAGLIKPKEGEVFLFHDKMNSLKEFKKYRSDIGYLPQDVSDFFLCPTVIEDVMFNLRAKGVKKDEAYEKALNTLTELGIEHLEERNIYDLSGGEQKIVALAGILITKPKILLLDEPTNALDEDAEKKIVEILNSIKKSMIIVSHHKSFIESLTPTIYKLDNKSLQKVN